MLLIKLADAIIDSREGGSEEAILTGCPCNHTGGGFPWFIFPLGGWGIGILFHFLGVYVFEGKLDKAAIEREVEKIRRE